MCAVDLVCVAIVIRGFFGCVAVELSSATVEEYHLLREYLSDRHLRLRLV